MRTKIEQYKDACRGRGIHIFMPGEKVLIQKNYFKPGTYGHREAINRTVFAFLDYAENPAFCTIKDSTGFRFQTCPHEIYPAKWADIGHNRQRA